MIDLDLPKYDNSDCSELEYAIYERNDYGSVKSRRDCDPKKLGAVFDPFKTGNMCDGGKYGGNKGKGDMYFTCKHGDLSGRCGTIEVGKSRSVDMECNVSEESKSKEG